MTQERTYWRIQLQNEEIQAKWTEEVLEYGRQSAEGFSETMAQFMISELVLKSKEHSTSGWIVAYDPGVLKSDVAISNDLKLELQTAIEPLENVSETAKDWHPNSNNQVLDLVHPSLWPLMYGYTKILVPPRKCNDDPLTNLGAGILLQPITTEAVPWEYSKVFQWLPADMQYNDKKEPK